MCSDVHYGDERRSPLLYCSLLLVQLMLQLTWERWHTAFKILLKEGGFFLINQNGHRRRLKWLKRETAGVKNQFYLIQINIILTLSSSVRIVRRR